MNNTLRRYDMQDRSSLGTRIDNNLSIMQVYEMTDYSEEEFNKILDLEPGQEYLMDGGRIAVKRIS